VLKYEDKTNMVNSTKKEKFHTLPQDMRKAIASIKSIQTLWDDITPLARNEWICWVTSGAKAETRGIRLEKMLSKMKGGMRRPCCWAGCTHR
jgi:uncharacterized protein YdeI (YjbR/CyaY-like superfamily)